VRVGSSVSPLEIVGALSGCGPGREAHHCDKQMPGRVPPTCQSWARGWSRGWDDGISLRRLPRDGGGGPDALVAE